MLSRKVNQKDKIQIFDQNGDHLGIISFPYIKGSIQVDLDFPPECEIRHILKSKSTAPLHKRIQKPKEQ